MHRVVPASLHVDGRCTGLRVGRAERFWSRAAGLLLARRFAVPFALELRPCRAVHTWGMRFPIDVVFVAQDGLVLGTVSALAPWRFAWRRDAAATWELPAGSCAAHAVGPGVRLRAVSAERSAEPPVALATPGRECRSASASEPAQ